MAHKRKDTFTPSPEWWVHLRPCNKRRVAKAERREWKQAIRDERYDEAEEVDYRYSR